jgi:two-component sensor histidine kinase
VRIFFTRGEPSGWVLTVEDDGRGLSSAAPSVGTGLGRKVISAMAKNLDAAITFDPDHAGVRAIVRFEG